MPLFDDYGGAFGGGGVESARSLDAGLLLSPDPSDYDLFYGSGFNLGPSLELTGVSSSRPPIPKLKPPMIGGTSAVLSVANARDGNGNLVPVSASRPGLSWPVIVGAAGVGLLALYALRR